MRVEPHRLGIDSDGRSEVDAFGKIAAMKVMAHMPPPIGAQEKIATFRL
jgi:hypothetical protein